MNILRFTVITALLMALALMTTGCEGSGSSSKTSQSPMREKSPLVLKAASLEYGAELTWNEEQFPGAIFNVCLSEEKPEINSRDCFFYQDAMIEDDHASPMEISGLSGGEWWQAQSG